MKRLTIQQYLQTDEAYPVTPATVRKYIDKGILPGERINIGNKSTYFVHIIDQPANDLLERMLTG